VLAQELQAAVADEAHLAVHGPGIAGARWRSSGGGSSGVHLGSANDVTRNAFEMIITAHLVLERPTAPDLTEWLFSAARVRVTT